MAMGYPGPTAGFWMKEYLMCNKSITYAAQSLLGLCLAFALSPAHAQSGGDGVDWKNVIGIIMPGNTVGTGSKAITGGGQPWSTTGGDAHANLQNGEVAFNVRGLVLAGGNAIGTPGGVTQVAGTLVCDTNGDRTGTDGNSVTLDTSTVELNAAGDATFSGVFDDSDPDMTLAAKLQACAAEGASDIAFLIRNATSGTLGNWIANGAVLLRNGNAAPAQTPPPAANQPATTPPAATPTTPTAPVADPGTPTPPVAHDAVPGDSMHGGTL